VWSGTQIPEFRRNLQTSSSIPQMEGMDSSEVLLPVLQAAVTRCSLPSETQICCSSSFKHTLNLRRFSQNCAQRLLASSCISIRLSTWNNSAPTGQIFMKLSISLFSENMSRKFKVQLNLTRIIGTVYEDQYTFFIISRSVLFRMRNVSEAKCKESENTHVMFNNRFSEIVPFMR
jgi:hypothetical protein